MVQPNRCLVFCVHVADRYRAAELLNALPATDELDQDDDSQMFNADVPASSYRIFSTSYEDPDEAALEAKEAPRFLLAKTFFDTKEYDRCAAVFLPPAIPAGGLAIYEASKGRTPKSTPSKAKGKSRQSETVEPDPFPRLSQKSLFLALYARYIAGEKRKDEDSEMVLGPADGGQTINRELPALVRGLEEYFAARRAEDPELKHSQGWLEYLYGVILARSKQERAAQEWLLRSVRTCPYHWGAWEELCSLLANVDDLQKHLDPQVLPQNIMSLIYQTHASVDLSSTSDPNIRSDALNTLLRIFPASTFLLTELALSYYHNKDYESAAQTFEGILTSHPHRLDALDHYSNILYVMTDRPKLAFIAHLATSVDKFRPETCCVVGNYYSLCSQHEKAVMYFRRALTLDRNFLSAWTLMGHEYIELKNTHAAIESYRRAVDVNRKDYRAWYGLGQAYEMLDMGFYALFYYQRAAALRPYDMKMWQAVGSCYAKMDRLDQAIKALKRALVAGTYFETESPTVSFQTSIGSTGRGQGSKKKQKHAGGKLLDPETLFHIASLYERMGSEDEAAKYMELTVGQETGITALEIEQGERQRKRARKQEQRRLAAEARQERLRSQHLGVEAEQEDTDLGDGDTEILSDQSSSDEQTAVNESADTSDANLAAEAAAGPEGFGVGTTATTSKARLWLARHAWRRGDLDLAERYAEELCMDGFEVEEAKGLVREVRGRREELAGAGAGARAVSTAAAAGLGAMQAQAGPGTGI